MVMCIRAAADHQDLNALLAPSVKHYPGKAKVQRPTPELISHEPTPRADTPLELKKGFRHVSGLGFVELSILL